eukprot:scaffold2979_cov243-Pinguiococcus_pyrenoidosus.AAC.6
MPAGTGPRRRSALQPEGFQVARDLRWSWQDSGPHEGRCGRRQVHLRREGASGRLSVVLLLPSGLRRPTAGRH